MILGDMISSGLQCDRECGMDVELQFEGSERDVGILEFRKWRSLSLPAGLGVRSSCT